MNSAQEDFIRLIKDKTKSAEDVYNEMYTLHKELFSTSRILRHLLSWDNCMYQGAIGENNFIVASAFANALAPEADIAMTYDDYKDTMIKFIELFRQEYEKDPNKNIIAIIINISQKYLGEVFAGAARDGEDIYYQRYDASSFDELNQLKKYNVSSQKGPGRIAVCCERNVTIGNAFRFAGYEVYHVAGTLYPKGAPYEYEAHAFVIVKYGKEPGKYGLFDLFNGRYLPNALPGDYDFSKGIEIEVTDKEENKSYIYKVEGPLFEMTNELLQIESILRQLTDKLNVLERKSKHNLATGEDISAVREEVSNIMEAIKNSGIDDLFKERYYKKIGTLFETIDQLESSSNVSQSQLL